MKNWQLGIVANVTIWVTSRNPFKNAENGVVYPMYTVSWKFECASDLLYKQSCCVHSIINSITIVKFE